MLLNGPTSPVTTHYLIKTQTGINKILQHLTYLKARPPGKVGKTTMVQVSDLELYKGLTKCPYFFLKEALRLLFRGDFSYSLPGKGLTHAGWIFTDK